MELIADGTHSTVYHLPLLSPLLSPSTLSILRAKLGPDVTECCLKLIQAERAVMMPHDVGREVRVLRRLGHENIVELLHDEYDTNKASYNLYLPYYPYTLYTLVSDPNFTPFPPPSSIPPLPLPSTPFTSRLTSLSPLARANQFETLTRSLLAQLRSSMTYLHSPGINIAHRDLKPSNVLLSSEGTIKLCDFGTCWDGGGGSDRDRDGLGGDDWEYWDEGRGEMRKGKVLQVGSGCYRAPELLLGDVNYNPFKLDLWAVGVMLAEFFTPFLHITINGRRSINVEALKSDPNDSTAQAFQTTSESASDSEPDSDSDDDFLSHPRPVIPIYMRSTTTTTKPPKHKVWKRCSLFEGGMGEIGLMGSVLGVMGSPGEGNWKSYATLPDSSKLNFPRSDPVRLARLLPFADEDDGAAKAVEGLMRLDAGERGWEGVEGWLRES